MKKSLYYIVVFLGVATLLVGCNKDIMNTEYDYDTAVIYDKGEWKTVNIKSWTDYENRDQIQIKTDDGTVYLLHSSNCTLIKSK